MDNKTLESVMEAQFQHCADLLIEKGKEYAEDNPDRLRHFKRAAVLMDTTPKAALMGMLSKHLVSVSDMCMTGGHYDRARWREKLTDSINYLILLAALIAEENEQRNRLESIMTEEEARELREAYREAVRDE